MNALSTLLIDDDPSAVEYLSYLLHRELPQLKVTSRLNPDVGGRFDVYLIDNDFAGRRIAGQLTEEIRLRQPDALVIAFSASLDNSTLKELINAGCDAVADKANPDDHDMLLELIRRYGRAYRSAQSRTASIKRQPIVDSIVSLIREWNTSYRNSRGGTES